jgi:hypothetical protein
LQGERFDLEWDKLAKFIIDNANTTEKRLKNIKVWLQKMKLNAPKWAACYTWRHRTYGVHSTQRAEAIHSVIALFCSKHSSIIDLVMDIERMAEIQQNRAETDALRLQFNHTIGPGAKIMPVANALADLLEEYPAHILRCQASQISLYTHEETTDIDSQGNKIYIVSINSTLYDDSDRTLATSQRAMDYGLLEPGAPKYRTSINECSCQFEKCFGIPCRHRFYIMLVTGYSGVSDQNTFRDLTHDTLNSSFVYFFLNTCNISKSHATGSGTNGATKRGVLCCLFPISNRLV